MDAPRDLFYDPMRQIYDKARHDKFVKDKTNEELEALNTAATNIFSREINWKNRGYDSAAIVAPINIGEKEYICEVIVKQEKTQNSFYLHEVQLKEKVAGAFKTSTGEVAPATEPSLFKSILVENYFNIKNNVSKIIDKNGEPLVVYHGTNAKFNVFEYGDIGFHFGTKESAKSRGETVGEYFLNIKNTPSTVY